MARAILFDLDRVLVDPLSTTVRSSKSAASCVVDSIAGRTPEIATVLAAALATIPLTVRGQQVARAGPVARPGPRPPSRTHQGDPTT